MSEWQVEACCPIPEGSKFCMFCGKRLQNKEELERERLQRLIKGYVNHDKVKTNER